MLLIVASAWSIVAYVYRYEKQMNFARYKIDDFADAINEYSAEREAGLF